MDKILELASKLGKQVAEDPRAVRMAEAQKALSESLQDRQLLADYESQQKKIYELEARNTPVEPEDKRKLAELHQKVTGSDVIKAIVKAQADYVELMTTVSRKIEEESLGGGGDKE